MILGSGSIIFIDASNMICRKTSAGKGVTPRLPSTPSQLGRQCGSGDLDLGQAGSSVWEVSWLGRPRPRKVGSGEQGLALGLTGLNLGS
jgi:hypothetical protein